MNFTELINLGLKAVGVITVFGLVLLVICVIAGAREERRMKRMVARMHYDYPEA